MTYRDCILISLKLKLAQSLRQLGNNDVDPIMEESKISGYVFEVRFRKLLSQKQSYPFVFLFNQNEKFSLAHFSVLLIACHFQVIMMSRSTYSKV